MNGDKKTEINTSTVNLIINNISFINLNKIIEDADYYTSIYLFDTFGITEVNYNTRDQRAQLVSKIIHTLCESILQCNNKVIVTFCESCLNVNLQQHMSKLVSKLRKFLPIHFFVTDYSYSKLIRGIATNNEDIQSLLRIEISKSRNQDNSKFSFQKLHNFLKRSGLTYLHQAYFKQLNAKLLITK